MMYDFKIEYVNTKEFGCVDVLSRLIDTNMKPDEDIVIACAMLEEDCSATLNDHFNSLPITFNMVLKTTNKCKTLQSVISKLQDGWNNNVSSELNPFYVRRDQLSVVQGCLMFNDRIVIPPKLRNCVLKQLHRGHPGKERMKALARSHVYWPGIDEDIITYVRNCHQCAVACSAPVKHTLKSWPLTNKPMERIHIDIAGPCNGLYYFVVIDAFSKWPEIFEISNITSTTIISKLTEMFARYGDADTIVSDNGTQFVSSQFNKFVADRGITHLRTAPYHPQSNGQAERFVGILKRALEKLKQEGTCKENLETFLQTYRSTPRIDSKSPAELFLNRKIKTTLDLLKPKEVAPIRRNIQQEMIFNRKHGAKAKSFKANENVFVQIFKNNKFIWVTGSIVERVGTVNYNVLVNDKSKQKLIRSHANQIKKRFESNNEPINSAHLLFEMFDLYKTPENIPETQRESTLVEPDQPIFTEQNAAVETDTDVEINFNTNVQNEPDSSFHSTSDSIGVETISSPATAETSRPKRNCQPPVWLKNYSTS